MTSMAQRLLSRITGADRGILFRLQPDDRRRVNAFRLENRHGSMKITRVS